MCIHTCTVHILILTCVPDHSVLLAIKNIAHVLTLGKNAAHASKACPAYIHTYIHTYVHTYVHANIRTNARATYILYALTYKLPTSSSNWSVISDMLAGIIFVFPGGTCPAYLRNMPRAFCTLPCLFLNLSSIAANSLI